jgi:hypothetical protein
MFELDSSCDIKWNQISVDESNCQICILRMINLKTAAMAFGGHVEVQISTNR